MPAIRKENRVFNGTATTAAAAAARLGVTARVKDDDIRERKATRTCPTAMSSDAHL